MASILLDKSLTVLENWTSCQDFFTQNKARIKRLCYEYQKMTSVAIIRLMSKSHANSCTSRFKQNIIHKRFDSYHLTSKQKVECAGEISTGK